MILNLVAKIGEKNNLVPEYKEEKLVCEVSKTCRPNDLYYFLTNSLSKYSDTEIRVDYQSFLDLGLVSIPGDSLEMVLFSTVEKHNFEPFVIKSEENKDKKKWTVSKDPSPETKTLLEAQNFTRVLQETPPNLMTPEIFAKRSMEFLKDLENVTVREISGKELEDKNFNLIISVGKASCFPPRLLIIEYKPNTDQPKVLVGKGVCYDSGGLNVKTGFHMLTMKFDMSGGASSVGVIYALAKNKSKSPVTVLVPLAENSIDGNAFKPDDVIVSYSGKSVEIGNTDAEGRLVLADALSYGVREYKPKEIISIATLTGAVAYALGYKYGGAWATEESSWERLYKSSIEAGDHIWRLPLDEYYLKILKSRVADIKNTANTGVGSSSRAACFLKEFIEGTPYIHLDIANIAHGESDTVSNAPLVRTLYRYLYS